MTTRDAKGSCCGKRMTEAFMERVAHVEIPEIVTRADPIVGPTLGRWTVADLEALPNDGVRYELLEGVVYMAPPPVPDHQDASFWFTFYLGAHIRIPGLGRVYAAPIGLELDEETYFEPDIVVILNNNPNIIIGTKRLIGVPDLIVEIASPSTALYDRDASRGKLGAYARAGLPEYWIANPRAKTVEVFVLNDRSYTSKGVFQGDARLPVGALPELPVHIAQFFQD